MKNKYNYFRFTVWFLLVFLQINAFDLSLLKKIEIHLPPNKNLTKLYSDFFLGIGLMGYDGENDILFLGLQSLTEKTHSRQIAVDSMKGYLTTIEYFNQNGEHLGTLGIYNTFRNGGIINPVYIDVSKSGSVIIVDNQTHRVNIYKWRQGVYRFSFSINYQEVSLGYIFKLNKDKMYYSYPNGLFMTHTYSGATANIVADQRYVNSRNLSNISLLLDCSKYRSKLGYPDPNLPKETARFFEIVKTSGLYTKVFYDFLNDGEYFAMNGYGTELFHFSREDSLLKITKVSLFENIRNQELSENKHRIVSWANNYCEASNLLLTNNQSKLMIYYRLSSVLAQEKGYRRFIIFYDVNTLREISGIIPIDFIPVCFISDDILVGVNISSKKVFLEYYNMVP